MISLMERSFTVKPVIWGLQVLDLFPLNQYPSLSQKCTLSRNRSWSNIHFSTFSYIWTTVRQLTESKGQTYLLGFSAVCPERGLCMAVQNYSLSGLCYQFLFHWLTIALWDSSDFLCEYETMAKVKKFLSWV